MIHPFLPMITPDTKIVSRCLILRSPCFRVEKALSWKVGGTAYERSMHGHRSRVARCCIPVYEADTLRTGADGRVGLTLKDDTRLSLGPSSEIRLDKFAYAPAEGRLGFVLNVVRGMAAYVSGRIAKLAPDAVRLETPAAIVGVRGTTVVLRASQG